jgi:hypothetical protein
MSVTIDNFVSQSYADIWAEAVAKSRGPNEIKEITEIIFLKMYGM